MRVIQSAIFTLILFGCNNQTDKKSVESETVRGSLLRVESFYNDENLIQSDAENKELHNCDFDTFINDPKTPKLAKDIYLEREWNLNNDNETLALLDSLTAKEKTSRPFYFKVITKTKGKSDGYFAEELGLAGYEFVENHAQEFFSYFDNKPCHTEIDLMTWADILIVEFSISGEGEYDKPIVDVYIKKLKSNCKSCSTTQKETNKKFGIILKEKWSEFLKHLD